MCLYLCVVLFDYIHVSYHQCINMSVWKRLCQRSLIFIVININTKRRKIIKYSHLRACELINYILEPMFYLALKQF